MNRCVGRLPRAGLASLLLLAGGCRTAKVPVSEPAPVPALPAGGQEIPGSEAARIAPPDVAYLEGGDEFTGRLRQIDAAGVSFATEDGDVLRWTREEIQRVTVAKARRYAGIDRVQDLPDEALRTLWRDAPGPGDYPDAGYVVLRTVKFYRLEADGSSVRSIRRTIRILKDRGKSAANVVVSYLEDREEPEIVHAISISPEGEVRHLSDAAVSDSSANSNLPDYDRKRLFKFALPQVEIGTLIDYEVLVRRAKNDLLHPFSATEVFRGTEPLVEKRLVVEVPRGVRLRTETRNFAGGGTAKSRAGGYDRVEWRVTGQTPIVSEGMMPPVTDYAPTVSFSAGSTWKEICRAYLEAMESAARDPEGLIATRAAEWAGEARGPEAARRLYEKVVREIRDAPVPPSDFQYEPKPATEILRKGVANGIDKPFLLYALMKAAGMDAEFVLVRGQGAGDLFGKAPTVGQFSAGLVVCRGRGEPTRWVAVTSDRVPFGVLPASYQGGWALRPERAGRPVPTPVAPPEEESRVSTFRMTMDPDGSVEVSKQVELSGQSAIGFRGLKEARDEEIRRSFQQSVSRIDARARLLSYEISDLNDLETPVVYRVRYRIPGYALRSGDRMLAFRIPELDYSASIVAKPERTYDLDWSSKLELRTVIEMRIPDGYRVYYRPQGRSYRTRWLRFESKIRERSEDGFGSAILEYRDRYVRDSLRQPASAWDELRECLQTRARLSREYLVLEKSGE